MPSSRNGVRSSLAALSAPHRRRWGMRVSPRLRRVESKIRYKPLLKTRDGEEYCQPGKYCGITSCLHCMASKGALSFRGSEIARCCSLRRSRRNGIALAFCSGSAPWEIKEYVLPTFFCLGLLFALGACLTLEVRPSIGPRHGPSFRSCKSNQTACLGHLARFAGSASVPRYCCARGVHVPRSIPLLRRDMCIPRAGTQADIATSIKVTRRSRDRLVRRELLVPVGWPWHSRVCQFGQTRFQMRESRSSIGMG